MAGGQSVGGSGNIKLCPDGKYRWYYEFGMLENPMVLITVIKVLLIASLAPALVTMLGTLSRGFAETIRAGVEVYGIMMLIMIPLGVLAYLILAGIYGWKYIVLFVMDEDGVTHIQQNKQFKKAQAISWLNVAMGLAAGNPGRVGGGILTGTKNSSSSDFVRVKKVIGHRMFKTIKLNASLSYNQVYVEKEDYDFVWDYITARCENAKIR